MHRGQRASLGNQTDHAIKAGYKRAADFFATQHKFLLLPGRHPYKTSMLYLFKTIKPAQFAVTVALIFSTIATPSYAQVQKLEKTKVVIALAGVSSQIYMLVMNLTTRLGHFKDEGLDVEIVDTGSGTKGVQALLGGSADLTAGAYEHTIQMQPKGIDLRCFALFGRSGGTVLGIIKSNSRPGSTTKDLKGQVIGVSAPGSSTHTFLNAVLGENGIKPDDVSILAVGNAAGAVAAARSGRLGGISGVDPVMTELELAGDIVVIADARSPEGSRAVYQGPYASGCLYSTADFISKNPVVVQALTNAITRTLRWVKTAKVDQILAILPAEYSKENPSYRTAVERNLSGIPEQAMIEEEAAKTVLRMVIRANPSFDASKIDLKKTYDNRFSLIASQKYK